LNNSNPQFQQFYLDTRYYESDSSGNLTLVTSNELNATADYVSYSHGLYSRNAHGQEILLRPTNITVRRVPESRVLQSFSVYHLGFVADSTILSSAQIVSRDCPWTLHASGRSNTDHKIYQWRLLGGNIDLYFYAGPTQPEVTAAYQKSAIGLPVMQQYFTFGFQCVLSSP